MNFNVVSTLKRIQNDWAVIALPAVDPKTLFTVRHIDCAGHLQRVVSVRQDLAEK